MQGDGCSREAVPSKQAKVQSVDELRKHASKQASKKGGVIRTVRIARFRFSLALLARAKRQTTLVRGTVDDPLVAR
jgi:hypothetical protein